jgi:bisanhydrobacterioruberin hydratase
MGNNDANAGRVGFLIMCAITAGILLSAPFTILFVDTERVLTTPGPGILEFCMWGIMCLAIPFSIWHSIVTKGLIPGLTVIAFTIFAAWLAEGVGVNYGMWFGSYHYTELFNPKIWGVPIIICIAWEPILYGAYLVTDFLVPIKVDKNEPWAKKLVPLLVLSFIGCLVTTMMDLPADADAVQRGWWLWHDGGPWMTDINGGVPVKNYVGWLGLSFICMIAYRLAGYFSTATKHSVYLDVYIRPIMYLQVAMFIEGFAWIYLKRPDVILSGIGMMAVALFGVMKAVAYKMGYGREAYAYLNDENNALSNKYRQAA